MVANTKEVIMKNLKKEFPFIFIALIPFIYLAYIWNQLPEIIPLHWNASGEIDRMGNKNEIIFPVVLLTILPYLIFAFLPAIDPKKNLQKMENKLKYLRFFISLFMSALSVYILYSIQQLDSKPTFIFALVGLLFASLGNYFKTIKPNYFIGIRTPWTLENEEVWKKTHVLGGKLWFAGGLAIFLLSFILKNNYSFYILMIIVGVITIIPITYSYLEFKKLNN